MEILPGTSIIVLAIESSCDDMAVAVLNGPKVMSSIVASQSEHAIFGGVVPEIASRAHLTLITRTVETALQDADISRDSLDVVAVTRGPGLPGSLIVGNSFARAFADGLRIPVVGINHLEGHIYSVFLDRQGPDFPFLSLIVSGGHSQLVLVEGPSKYDVMGKTRDDAAGEAFDKVGKLFGLNYPAGPEIDRLSRTGDPKFHTFPRTRLDAFDFSFSGIKTSVLYFLNSKSQEQRKKLFDNHLSDLCASFQTAIVDMLVDKFTEAILKSGVKNASIVGGVSANTELRRRAREACSAAGIELHFPEKKYCTDNAAMIGIAAMMTTTSETVSDENLTIAPNLNL